MFLAAVLVVSACGRTDTDTGSVTASLLTDPLGRPTEGWTVDRPTEDWFTAWCSAVTSLPASMDDLGDAEALHRLGDQVVTDSVGLGSMPSPTFDGAAEFAAQQVSALASTGAAFHLAAQQWDAGHTEDARTVVDQAVGSARPVVDTLDPVVGTQVWNLPACRSVTPTS